MNTPYDAALRIADRELDDIRSAIGRTVADLDRIDSAHIAATAALERECLLAANDHLLLTERYFVHVRGLHAALAKERAATRTELEKLQRVAVTRYGERQAIGNAVERYRADAARTAAAAEQAAADDITGGRYRPPRRRRTRGPAPAP